MIRFTRSRSTGAGAGSAVSVVARREAALTLRCWPVSGVNVCGCVSERREHDRCSDAEGPADRPQTRRCEEESRQLAADKIRLVNARTSVCDRLL